MCGTGGDAVPEPWAASSEVAFRRGGQQHGLRHPLPPSVPSSVPGPVFRRRSPSPGRPPPCSAAAGRPRVKGAVGTGILAARPPAAAQSCLDCFVVSHWNSCRIPIFDFLNIKHRPPRPLPDHSCVWLVVREALSV